MSISRAATAAAVTANAAAVTANAAGAENPFASALGGVLFSKGRSIAGFVPDVIVKEVHQDNLTITQHPIEAGAAISDHAYNEMPTLEMTVLWRYLANGLISGLLDKAGSSGDTYTDLLTLQANREPFDVMTGKREYKDVLLTAIEVKTDADTENSLSATLTFQQLFIVRTEFVDISGLDTDADMLPENGGVPQNTGKQIAKNGSGYRGEVDSTNIGGQADSEELGRSFALEPNGVVSYTEVGP